MTMITRKRGTSHQVVEKETGLIWRSFNTRHEAESWADEADPRRKDK